MNISEKAKGIIDSCRFCWMCRHICPIGNATGQERNTARARALGASLVVRGATDLKEIADNVYECTLCGACTNNCMTGWDPKVFIQELKREIVLNGVTPNYIIKLLENYQNKGNVYGVDVCSCLDELCNKDSKILFFAGADAICNSPKSVKTAISLVNKAGTKVSFNKNQDSGNDLWFLTGATAETQNVAISCAQELNKYEKVVVYNPVDLKLMLHEYKEWGIEIKAELISFNVFVLSLIKSGALKVQKNACEYSLQDNYAYARELDDVTTGRKLIEKVGTVKDMLLIGKEANLAGNSIMSLYMPEVLVQVAKDRWTNALNMDCKTVVTENPSEYEALKATTPDGCKVVSIEEMILENL